MRLEFANVMPDRKSGDWQPGHGWAVQAEGAIDRHGVLRKVVVPAMAASPANRLPLGSASVSGTLQVRHFIPLGHANNQTKVGRENIVNITSKKSPLMIMRCNSLFCVNL
ncbi:hypothetical protein [Pseudomonas sp.]|uniref:hypothetical protein n=1 Tax=Pseudomonas sp. TaxID=306 RepID=UPI0028AC18E3|nr:hypothetical protein [Pseudomonas sp.]